MTWMFSTRPKLIIVSRTWHKASSPESFAAAAQVYDQQLRDYLEKNLSTSAAYVLLVTPESLAADSAWIKFEIEQASQKARAVNGLYFFPCAADGAKLTQLPGQSQEFQGIELRDHDSMAKLVEAIDRAIRNAPSRQAQSKLG